MLPTFTFHHTSSDQLDLILPGSSGGIETPFVQELLQARNNTGNSVVALNFPFHDRGEDHSSGEELLEEQNTLDELFTFLAQFEYQQVNFIAKSLGGIIAAEFLRNRVDDYRYKFSVTILGYTKWTDLTHFAGPITVIQGEKDKYGDVDWVRSQLKDAQSQAIEYIQIPEADHSYVDVETGEERQKEVVAALKEDM